MKAKDENDPIEMIREMPGYQPKANHVDDNEDGVDAEVNPIFDRIVAERGEAKKAAVSGKKRPTECASKTTAKDVTDINETLEMLRKMFGNKPKANHVDDDKEAELKAIIAIMVAEKEEAKKAAVSGKKRPTESASKTTAKDETDKDGSIEMIREMSGYQPKANHVDDDEDGVDDEVNPIFYRIVAEGEEAKKAAVSGKKWPTECASKTTAKDETDINESEPKAIDVDDDEEAELKAIIASMVAEKEEAKKAAVSGKKRPTESASKTTAKDETDKDGSIEMIREMSGYQPKANHVDDDEDGGDDEIKAIFDRIVAEGEEAKKAAVSGKKRPTECASKTTAKDETDINGTRVMLRKMFESEPKANDVDDDEEAELKAFLASMVAEKEEAKKAAVSGKKRPTESASKTTAKDGSIEMIREMSGYQPKANHVDDDEDGVDDEVKAIFDRIVAEGEEAKKAAVSGKKRPTESASKTPATEKKAKLISTAGNSF
ncbi:putative nucleolin-like family protein isoform X2 [Iris pallida]|uniref:Nucleolin-like family protein isoform X2 n=1 Tax=Iris pallida TaxID=29817 RepID=A0AAX6IKQ6_IRIPA|nr:putative nucleolin-like family protein isoform X2 [Iris pallida]